ncbi:MAG: cell division ATPase MinD [Candidatus Hydrothermarchaeaceae archaeon]
MGLSITIASGKGGTGKTTISANLGVALAQLGKDTIILDADIEMANLELHLGLEGMKTTLHNVLAGEADIKDAIYDGPGGVKAVPAGMRLDGLGKIEYDRLKDVLNELAKTCEVLLIDVPSGIGRTVIVALSTGEEILLIATPEISAMSDVLKTKIVAKKLGADILGVVLNRALFDKSDLTVKEVEAILETKVVAVIPEDAEIKKSLTSEQPAVLRSPDAPAVIAIKKLAARLVDEEREEDEEQPTPPPPESPETGFMEKLKSGIFGR